MHHLPICNLYSLAGKVCSCCRSCECEWWESPLATLSQKQENATNAKFYVVSLRISFVSSWNRDWLISYSFPIDQDIKATHLLCCAFFIIWIGSIYLSSCFQMFSNFSNHFWRVRQCPTKLTCGKFPTMEGNLLKSDPLSWCCEDHACSDWHFNSQSDCPEAGFTLWTASWSNRS